MRHRKKFNHLGRKSAHRKSMLANMACSLIEHKRINTTVAKAKALRQYVEPIITRSKNDTTHNRRMAFRYLRNKYAVTELFREISEKVGDRPGGYTRIIKLGNRLGDNADMAMIELVDYNTSYNTDKPAKKKSRRSRRKKKGDGAEETSAVTVETEVAEPETTVEEVETSQEEPEETPEAIEENPPVEDVNASDENEAEDTEEKEG